MSYCEGGDLATQAMRIPEIVQLWASAWQILTKEALHVTYDSYLYDLYDLYDAAVRNEMKWTNILNEKMDHGRVSYRLRDQLGTRCSAANRRAADLEMDDAGEESDVAT